MQPMSASGVARPLPWRAPIPAFWLREIPVFALGAILGQQLVCWTRGQVPGRDGALCLFSPPIPVPR